MATFPWVRLWTSLPTDPKLRIVAAASGQPISLVLSVFVYMLTDAANETPRGVTTVTDEEIGFALAVSTQDVAAVRDAMQGRLLDGKRITGWRKRQPVSEDSSTERVRRWRAKHSDDVTVGNARGEERRGEEKRENQEESKAAPSPARARLRRVHSTPYLRIDPTPTDDGLPLAGGVYAVLTPEGHGELSRLYPGVDVTVELRSMRGWLLSNPEKRKTPRGVFAFVTRWLGKEQDRSTRFSPPRAQSVDEAAEKDAYARRVLAEMRRKAEAG